MELGTGIFLGAIVGSVTALFIATKDRWKWKKIILWPLGLLALAGAGLGGWLAIDNYLRERVTPHDTMWGLKLGQSTKEDVVFMKGEPPSKKNEDVWSYPKKDTYSNDAWEIGFADGKVVAITYLGQSYIGEQLSGIGYSDSTKNVTDKFGEPDTTWKSEDNLWRIYCYEKFNVFFNMSGDKVQSYGLFTKGGEKSILCGSRQ